MDTVELQTLFDPKYGNKFDANKMMFVDNGEINFISRDSKNNGCVGTVNQYAGKLPYQEGLITVSLGGSYLLSSFLQPKKFYTAQNVAVLIPKKLMTNAEKIYYCKCISMNRFKYSAFGREANKSLKHLKIPSSVPAWVTEYDPSNLSLLKSKLKESKEKTGVILSDRHWDWFEYQKLFTIERGRGARKTDITENGNVPLITSIDSNNGLIGYVNKSPAHQGNVITVNRNGSIGKAYYQFKPFCSTEDVHVFIPLFKSSIFIAMFLIPLIMKETYRYSYGRKWGIARMKKTKMKLPITPIGEPDWQFMEDYIKSLPYSSNL